MNVLFSFYNGILLHSATTGHLCHLEMHPFNPRTYATWLRSKLWPTTLS